MIRNGIAAAMAAWVSIGATGAHAAVQAEAPCFTQAEIESVVTLIAAPAVRAAKLACLPTLGANSYLGTRGEALAARFEVESGAALPVAMAAARKIPGMSEVNADTAKQVLTAMVALGITKIKPEVCRELDQGLLTIDPLPARNVSQLIAQIVRLSQLDKSKPDFKICRQQS